MNIYFTASISLKSQYGSNYEAIVSQLQKTGHKVIHEHITGYSQDQINKFDDEYLSDYYKKVLRWISEADLIVAEVSFPSTLNIGHEVSVALEKGKTVVALYVQDKASAFFKGLKSDKFIYEEYSSDSLQDVLEEAVDLAQGASDTRFNFLISPNLLEYLDWVAKNRRIPRSVYLRRLIEADRDKNKDYKGS